MKSYASNPHASRGRLVAEEESANRSVFQRDRDRIIHSTAFRRLAHKTQVFVYHEGDHYRTRLTHSIEVAQIARSIAHTLELNEDLAEAVALAHDLGHTPFGHAGEEALDLCMRDFGGFDHNEQTFRIVTLLERRYALFDGLNLTWETLEGVVKHNGPLIGPHASAKAQARSVPATIEQYCTRQNLEVDGFAGLEAQVAAISDDIAYNNHDLDDGLRAGLFTIADLADVPLAGPVMAEVTRKYPGIEQPRLIHEAIRRMINLMVRDVVAESTRRLADAGVKSVEDVRRQKSAMIGFSDAMRANDRGLKQFLFTRMYRHHRVNEMTHKAKLIVAELFDTLMDRPEALPAEWRAMAVGADRTQMARLVADYIAGMTDKFALETQSQLLN